MAMKPSTFNKIILASTLAAFLVTGGVAAVVLMDAGASPEYKAVRQYLSDHYEIGKIEIIEVSKPVPYKGGKTSLVRAKYKMPSVLGGMKALHVDVFELVDGKADTMSRTKGPGYYAEEIFDKGMPADSPEFKGGLFTP